MDFQELKALDDQYVMHTYGRFPVDVDHGENATLYDALGRSYIDFSSGIGVNSIGCAHPRWRQSRNRVYSALFRNGIQPGRRSRHLAY